MIKRIIITAVTAAAAVVMAAALSACAFLPVEDEPLAAPVLRPYERRQINTVAVRRGDLVQNKTISCRSRPIREENYKFDIGGIYVERVYVSVGDSVKKGDMLAELERREILVQAEEARLAVIKQEFAVESAKEDSALRRAERLMNSEGDPDAREALTAAYEKAYEDYLFNVSYAEKMLEIAVRKYETLQEMAEERVIYSTLDGVVSYAQRFQPQDRSIAGERAFTVSDSSELIYAVTGDDALFFTSGEVYSVKISKTFTDMRAISPEELDGETPANPIMYFTPEDLTGGLATYGYITVEIQRRDNVLFLPAAAIITVGEYQAIYRVGESGFRELAPIETGVTITGKTEILSGLSEGDEVIFD